MMADDSYFVLDVVGIGCREMRLPLYVGVLYLE